MKDGGESRSIAHAPPHEDFPINFPHVIRSIEIDVYGCIALRDQKEVLC
jgi:hypothetical protein